MHLTLLVTAFAAGILHVCFGPDHYVPLIALSKSRGWKAAQTAWITLLCGLAHLLFAVFAGWVGLRLGFSLQKFRVFNAGLEFWASSSLMVFGFVYLIYGLQQGFKRTWAPVISKMPFPYFAWIAFLILTIGPCEPLIPFFVIPALGHHWGAAIAASLSFSAATLVAMLSMVLIPLYGMSAFREIRLGRYAHAFAGAAMMFVGFGCLFFGW